MKKSVIFLSLLFASCGTQQVPDSGTVGTTTRSTKAGSGGSTNVSRSGSGIGNPNLAGVWKRSECSNKSHSDGTPYSKMKAKVFDGSIYQKIYWYSEGPNCDPSKIYKKKRYLGSFVLGGMAPGLTETWNIDIAYTHFFRTYYSMPLHDVAGKEDRVAHENRKAKCGITNWAHGVEQDVTNRPCSHSHPTIYAPRRIYEIINISNDRMVFGHPDSNPQNHHTGLTAAERPNQLYSTPYIRTNWSELPTL